MLMTVSYTSCVARFNQHRFRLELFKEAWSVHLIVSSSLPGSCWWFSHSRQCQNGSSFPIEGTCWRQINHAGKRLRPGGITLIRHQALGASYKRKAALRSIKGIRMRVRVAFCTVTSRVNGCSSLGADFLFALSRLRFSHFPLFTVAE